MSKIPYTKVHFTGIFGSGMSALAQYLCWAGTAVSGSDRLLGEESVREMHRGLQQIGCSIVPQDGSGISDTTQALIYSTAIEDSNPDIAAAKKRSVPLIHRSDLLAVLANTHKTVAVAGTSGKSTVTALIFHVLEHCGMAPSLLCGAHLHQLVKNGFIGNARFGASDIMVIEADESDGTLVKYKPWISIFLNLSKDHKSIEEVADLFKMLAQQSSVVFINNDDDNLKMVSGSANTFGVSPDARWHPDEITLTGNAAGMVLDGNVYTVPYPGKHMVYNMLAALAVSRFAGCTEDKCIQALAQYGGLQRRFDCIRTERGVSVIDDYAHNPEKIAAMLRTVQMLSPRVFAFFQPHGFTPTQFMAHELVHTFSKMIRPGDFLYILPIYYAGGTVQKTISSESLVRDIVKSGVFQGTAYAPDHRDAVIPSICEQVRKDDIVLIMGARDPSLPLYAKKVACAIDRC